MDSLTQVTLGAAVGEIVLGRKIGNRAMFWGAVAGTIPDLDVFSEYFVTPVQDLAIHRGFSHSIVFSILGAFVIGWIVDHIYKSKYHKYFGFVGWLGVPVAVLYFLARIFDMDMGEPKNMLLLALVLIAFVLWLYRKYFVKPHQLLDVSRSEWRMLFFWSLFTHPILDCFTTYGTQLLLPFTSYRVAFATISVADPLYTFPFLLCVIIASFLNRSNRLRRNLTILGLAMSSSYLFWTVWNKYKVHEIWKENLEQKEISYSDLLTTPTILNNILWYGVAETDDGYYHGLYSFWDSDTDIDLQFTPKNYDLLDARKDDPTIKTLAWFSDGFYSASAKENGELIINDLRFGSINDPNKDDQVEFIFSFPVQKNEEGYYEITRSFEGPPGDRQEMLQNLIKRVKGQ